MSDLIIGRNACMEALKAGRSIRRITVLKSRDGRAAEGSLKKILAMAKDQGVQIQYRDRSDLDKMSGGAVHQGVIAQAEEYGHSLLREYAFLVAHSMFHLMGYDHMTPDEEEVMTARQEAVLKALQITRNGHFEKS